MKRVLINSKEPGRILEVVEPGNEFETHPDFTWIDCNNDNVDNGWVYEENNGVYTWIEFDATQEEEFVNNGYKYARVIAYKDIGEQLDMIYKELMENGSLSADGAWASHITTVKNSVPKDPASVLEWYKNNAPTEE